MVWISSLSTAVAEVWPAVGFRLVPLSPSLSVLLDRVRTSWEGRRVRKRKRVNGEGLFKLLFLPTVSQKGAEATDKRQVTCWMRKMGQEVKATQAKKDIIEIVVKDLMR